MYQECEVIFERARRKPNAEFTILRLTMANTQIFFWDHALKVA